MTEPLESTRPDQTPGKAPGSAPGAGAEAKVAFQDVHKAFGDLVVLDGLDLEVTEGESLVVIGGSGVGKSVMLKHVIGLLHPDSGRVLVDGADLAQMGNRELTRFRSRFGMAFQEGALFDSMTVSGNVGFALRRLTDLSPRQIADRVDECLGLVRLEGVGEKMPSELSGGMRRRVGFARAIAHEPEILLFDEPTTGLDPVTTALIDEVIVDLTTSLRTTAITITHDMASAFRIADRIGLLYRGRIVALAPPEEFRALDDPRVQQFIHGEAEGPLSDPREALGRPRDAGTEAAGEAAGARDSERGAR
jgi:phospholipid/cholesterol/gamma-HCH transport system ATP-binding protein